MFSLREVEDGKFIYRCHVCGLESETMTTEQAAVYSRSHQCSPKAAVPAVVGSQNAS
jgi:hypothetical protein